MTCLSGPRVYCSQALLVLAFPIALSAGCVNPDVEHARQGVTDYMLGDYPHAQALLEPLAQKTDENFVLNNLRLGMTCLAEYRLDEAQAAFERAYEVVNSVGVNDGGRTLGAVLVSENLKIFKGEPFERAMLNFYLGSIYYLQGNYDNARGAFENATFKLQADADADPSAAGQTDSTFALGYLMLAKCWQHLGRDDLATANFSKCQQIAPALAPLCDAARESASNVCILADYGQGPEKITNDDGSLVGYSPTPWQAGRIPRPTVSVDGQFFPTAGDGQPTVDTLALGQERKWQSLDTIRAIKSTAGTALIIGGLGAAALSRNRDVQYGGLAAAGLGLLLKAASQADVRQWESLPRTVFVLPLHLPPGPHTISISIADDYYGGTISQTWQNLPAPAAGEAAYYFHLTRVSPGPFTWPPAGIASAAGPPAPPPAQSPTTIPP